VKFIRYDATFANTLQTTFADLAARGLLPSQQLSKGVKRAAPTSSVSPEKKKMLDSRRPASPPEQ
jgi:hypothetical protein